MKNIIAFALVALLIVGFGFIAGPDGDVLVHYRSLLQEGFKNLREGDQVQYRQIETETGLQASDVSIVQSQ